MEKERFLVEVTVKGEKDWKAIHMCGSMADAVPVADARVLDDVDTPDELARVEEAILRGR